MKFKINPKLKKALIDYVLAVAASAITMGVALLTEMEPHFAVIIGALTAPAVKWASKHSRDYGMNSK